MCVCHVETIKLTALSTVLYVLWPNGWG